MLVFVSMAQFFCQFKPLLTHDFHSFLAKSQPIKLMVTLAQKVEQLTLPGKGKAIIVDCESTLKAKVSVITLNIFKLL